MAPPTLMELLQKSATWLTGKGLGNGRREAEWIFADTLALTRLELYTRFDQPLSDDEVTRLRERVARRGRREPLAYVLGSQPFRSLSLSVSPAVLVPRPETEELIPLVLADLAAGARVLDVGTGSGAIALALKHERGDLEVAAVDASPAALEVARANAQRLELMVAFHQGDLATALPGGWNAVVANLPYIAENERGECDPELAMEPAMALFAGADGLELIRRLVADATRLLVPGGVLWLEHGHRQSDAVLALCKAVGLQASAHADGAGVARFCRAVRP